MENNSTSFQVAKTILAQLGGNRFMVMTGCKFPTAVPATEKNGPGLRLKLARNASKANYLYIYLNSMDLYDMVFVRADKRTGITEIERLEGYYNDMLAEGFERVTGLYTSL